MKNYKNICFKNEEMLCKTNMKKLFMAIIIFAVTAFMTSVCFAGDIPETLLYDDLSTVYFGIVKSINYENKSISVIQYKNVKGEFYKGKEIKYNNYYFINPVSEVKIPVENEIYLCGYTDENNPLYIWKVSGTETESLTVECDDNMSKRLQEYLNEGRFTEKEIIRFMKKLIASGNVFLKNSGGILF